MMDNIKRAAGEAKNALSAPSKLVDMYNTFILSNAGAVANVESAARSLTYLIPGRFRESEIATESLNSSVLLLSLYHDNLLSRALSQSLQGARRHQSPHTRYTQYYCNKSRTYKTTALALQIIQYTELLIEMMAKRRSEKEKWRVVILLESMKATCRLILMRLTNSRPLLSPPLPERSAMPEVQEEDIMSPPSERSEVSFAGSEQWTMPRTSLTLPPLPSSEDISSYLLSKVLTADDIKPAKQLLHPVSGLGEAAEIVYILRPVIYALAMAYWCQKEDGRGKSDWRPWLIGISIEFAAQQLARKDLETRPGGARGLTQLERDELKKRSWAMAWWAMRGAFYENVTRGVFRSLASPFKGRMLVNIISTFQEDYDYLWDNYYFPTASL